MKTFENEVDEMTDAVIKLTWKYTLFCILIEKKDAYIELREAHPEFCLTMYESLLDSFCVTVAFLYEDRKPKATSLCNLIRDLEGKKPDLANKLNEKIRATKDSISKIEILRNQVVAHRWEAKTPQQVWAKANVTLGILSEIVRLARIIIFELAGEAGGNRKETLEKQQLSEPTLRAIADDTRQMMRALARH
jgi:hypothetical protein